MELVDSVPQYAAIFKHCPNIIRAIVSIQANAFNLDVLYRSLSASRCSSCKSIGDHLYLIGCSRVCFLCFLLHMGAGILSLHHQRRIDILQARPSLVSAVL